MTIILSEGSGAADLVGLARALGRQGPGVLTRGDEGDVFEWTAPGGAAWRALGDEFALGPGAGEARGAPRTLSLAAGGFSLSAEGSGGLGVDLTALAGAEAPSPSMLDAALAGADDLRVFGSGGAALFGDAWRGAHLMEGAGDAYEGGAQPGGRRVSGDFWTVAAEAAQVRGGADVMVEAGRGALSLWGDAALMEDRAVADGGALTGGDDLIDASAAGRGGSGGARALFGDAGAVGRNWDVRGGDDVLRGPDGGAALAGDAGLLGDGARLVGGDDVLRGGAGRDALYGEARELGEGALAVAGADRLYGGAGADRLWGEAAMLGEGGSVAGAGRGGGDRIAGGAGADRAWGGVGDDRLFGGGGADRLRGEQGDDRLDGGAGDDRLWGGVGRDALAGGAGRDRLEGGDRADVLRGGDGADLAGGGAGADRLFGGGGADRLRGGEGDDRLFGGDGADRIAPGGGRDAATGGAGADVFVLRSGDGWIRIADFELGQDRLSLGAAAPFLSLSEGAQGVRGVAPGLRFRLDGVRLEALEAGPEEWLA
ncbi:MAG: hypothetical protein AAF763_11005 [Pseudomonadota bacterium]